MSKRNIDYFKNDNWLSEKINKISLKAHEKYIRLFKNPDPVYTHKESAVNYLNPPREVDLKSMTLVARVEYRTSKIDFTSQQDYPHNDFLIDELCNIQGKDERPFMYIIENKSGTHAAVIYSYTSRSWRAKSIHKWEHSKTYNFMMIDKELVRFCKVDEIF